MGIKIRKIVPLVLVIALVFPILVSTGCASETSKAKDYVNKGDEIIRSKQAEDRKVEATLQSIYKTLSSSNVTTSRQFKDMAATLDTQAVDPIKKANEAKAEFAHILDLSDVTDYKAYAKLRIAVINSVTELISTTSSYLKYNADVLASKEAGKPVDTTEYEKKSATYTAKINSLFKTTNESSRKADELKKQKNL